MALTYQQRWGELSPGQSRRRSGAMLLAIIVHILIILLLLRLAPLPEDHERSGSSLKTFQVAAQHAATAAKHAKTAPKQAAHAPAPSRPKPPVQIASHSAATTSTDAAAIWALGKGMYKGSDIAAIPSAKQGEATELADAGGGGGGEGNSKSVGAGPGGRLMYNAEWYTEPRDAEMRTYLPRTIVPSSWATIACQTAPQYHVENCRELDESPPGAGLTRALRQAAWQFRVRPPRVNGKPMIGAWVRIRFDFNEDGDVRVRR
ncbi:hypothetical protein [Sphingomonas bacterium]|uniref:hypothetical protein n=1 Tax=Sphingomonas bacterium TaxID=1895847 RepID=UPI0020C67E4C|nr:hypothetical protein [Sphingomonas bacterium]